MKLLQSLLIVFLFVISIVFIFTPNIVSTLFSYSDSSQYIVVSKLMRILLFSSFFFFLSSFMISIENVFHKFLAQSIAPVLYNIGIIIGIYYSSEFGIYSLAYGTVFGAFLYMLIQLPFFFSINIKWYSGFLSFKDLKYVCMTVAPRVLSISLTPLISFVYSIIATKMINGNLSVLMLAFNIESLAFGVIAISLSTVSYPFLSSLISKKKHDEFRTVLEDNFHKILFLIIPFVALLYVILPDLLSIIFLYKNFSIDSLDKLISISRLLI